MKNGVVEFAFGSEVVGCFTDTAPPVSPGLYPYEPYRGPGHFQMQEQLARSPAICSYVLGGTRILFQVLACPENGVLQLGVFDSHVESPA